MVRVGHGERHLRLFTARPSVVLADGGEPAVGIDDQRDVIVDVLLGGPPQLLFGNERARPEEAVVARRLAEMPVEPFEGGKIVEPRRTHAPGGQT